MFKRFFRFIKEDVFGIKDIFRIKIVNDWDDDTEIDKHLFIHNYLYYQVCEKLVATALKKFINNCKID